MDITEATESAGFWILGGVGTAMVLLGWIMSKKMDWVAMPLWQVLVMILIVWASSAFFATRE